MRYRDPVGQDTSRLLLDGSIKVQLDALVCTAGLGKLSLTHPSTHLWRCDVVTGVVGLLGRKHRVNVNEGWVIVAQCGRW